MSEAYDVWRHCVSLAAVPGYKNPVLDRSISRFQVFIYLCSGMKTCIVIKNMCVKLSSSFSLCKGCEVESSPPISTRSRCLFWLRFGHDRFRALTTQNLIDLELESGFNWSLQLRFQINHMASNYSELVLIVIVLLTPQLNCWSSSFLYFYIFYQEWTWYKLASTRFTFFSSQGE